jgi:nucleotide-binding universal stress UspA family protein
VDAILDAAERHGVGAVCVGSHGRSGVAKALLGSIAEACVKRSRRPVYVVRQ